MSAPIAMGRGPGAATPRETVPPRSGVRSPVAGLVSSGELYVWLTGGTLALCLLMIGGLLALVVARGLAVFWPPAVAEVRLADGKTLLGEVWGRETIPEPNAPADAVDRRRTQLRIGNRDLYGVDFRWVDDDQIVARSAPSDVVTLERQEWGNFYGRILSIRRGDQTVAQGNEDGWRALRELLPDARRTFRRVRGIERDEIGAVNARIEAARLEIRGLELAGAAEPARVAPLRQSIAEAEQDYARLTAELEKLYATMSSERITLQEVGGREKDMPVAEIVRAYRPNDLATIGKVRIYLSRLWEFASGEPRESNTEGGILPAIFGTFLMVVLMSLAVVPFGVLAAIYLREYAAQGGLVRVVRVAVNNLAGVPSIVFGVFGLGFFVYFLGGSIDRLFYPERLPTPTFGTGGILWAAATLALLTVPVVIVATEEALAAIPREVREGSLALGATQWETLWRVLLPASLPGILTGMILAMARGAGEVAPLMITGVVKLAPVLPLDGQWPFLHLERKFMHLGFHIYDVGFQSPNVEAAKPMVYTTTLLLLAVVLLINIVAILLRNRLRRRHRQAAV